MGNESDRDGGSFPKKPKTGGFKGASQRLRQGKENHISHRASLDWRQDQARVCDPRAGAGDRVDIEELKNLLMKSMTAASLLGSEGAGSLQIHYDPQVPLSQFYPRAGDCVITLNPCRPKGDLLNMLVREIRRAWQHQQGALVNPMNFEPDEAVLVNRAQQADVLMVSIKVAWELKLAGEAEAWNFMAGSPNLGDMTRVFEIHAQKDFRTLNNGEASRAAYDKFFEDSRTKLHDKRIIHQMLLDDHGYMKAPQKPARVNMELFKKLGEMPQGRNYLTISSKRSPTDMCYSTVEDRSNANFLWFIKFERSFQEKELQMLQESVKVSASVVDFSKWSLQARHAAEPGP
jgi:hypothetical protein